MKLYIAGIHGMVGSAVAEHAISLGHEVVGKSSTDLNLCNRDLVFEELISEKPDWLVIAAAKVGGIGANSNYPVNFLSENLQIQTNLIDASHVGGVERVLFLGSSCVYPKFSEQPISENSLLTGPLEATNEPYAVAKIAGLKLIEAYRKQYGHSWISAMPTSLYGERDNFDLNSAHVLPTLINKFHSAKINGEKTVSVWGDGSPLREFMHVRDLAEVVMLLLREYNDSVAINIGSGQEISILGLANLIAEIVGFEGELIFDASKPNGTPRKRLDNSLLAKLNWAPRLSLEQGITETYQWYLRNLDKGVKC